MKVQHHPKIPSKIIMSDGRDRVEIVCKHHRDCIRIVISPDRTPLSFPFIGAGSRKARVYFAKRGTLYTKESRKTRRYGHDTQRIEYSWEFLNAVQQDQRRKEEVDLQPVPGIRIQFT